MMKKLEKKSLLSDLAAVKSMLQELPESDIIGRIGFEARKEEIENSLAELDKEFDTLASVALYFHGDPVNGSRSIRAEFAAKAIEAYQELVAKRLADQENGGLAARGPIPSKEAAALNISAVVHGSFGFVLEEAGQDAPALINSSLKDAVDTTTDLLKHFTSKDEDEYSEEIKKMDSRVFSSAKKFIEILHEDKASLRIVEGDVDIDFSAHSIERAFERSQHTDISEKYMSVIGSLIGFIPIGKRFEFKVSETEIIKGKVGGFLTSEYMKRIEKEEQFVGKMWEAKLLKKEVNRPGRTPEVSYTLIDLLEVRSEK